MERLTPAQRHVRKVSAELAHSAENELLANSTEYEKMLYLLARHKKDLKGIQSREKKAEFKKSILPDYLPWIEGALKTGNGKQDNILMTWQVWAIDCGQFNLALMMIVNTPINRAKAHHAAGRTNQANGFLLRPHPAFLIGKENERRFHFSQTRA